MAERSDPQRSVLRDGGRLGTTTNVPRTQTRDGGSFGRLTALPRVYARDETLFRQRFYRKRSVFRLQKGYSESYILS